MNVDKFIAKDAKVQTSEKDHENDGNNNDDGSIMTFWSKHLSVIGSLADECVAEESKTGEKSTVECTNPTLPEESISEQNDVTCSATNDDSKKTRKKHLSLDKFLSIMDRLADEEVASVEQATVMSGISGQSFHCVDDQQKQPNTTPTAKRTSRKFLKRRGGSSDDDSIASVASFIKNTVKKHRLDGSSYHDYLLRQASEDSFVLDYLSENHVDRQEQVKHNDTDKDAIADYVEQSMKLDDQRSIKEFDIEEVISSVFVGHTNQRSHNDEGELVERTNRYKNELTEKEARMKARINSVEDLCCELQGLYTEITEFNRESSATDDALCF